MAVISAVVRNVPHHSACIDRLFPSNHVPLPPLTRMREKSRAPVFGDLDEAAFAIDSTLFGHKKVRLVPVLHRGIDDRQAISTSPPIPRGRPTHPTR
jgi:hypothetical protein